jgi:hypothetical protein
MAFGRRMTRSQRRVLGIGEDDMTTLMAEVVLVKDRPWLTASTSGKETDFDVLISRNDSDTVEVAAFSSREHMGVDADASDEHEERGTNNFLKECLEKGKKENSLKLEDHVASMKNLDDKWREHHRQQELTEQASRDELKEQGIIFLKSEHERLRQQAKSEVRVHEHELELVRHQVQIDIQEARNKMEEDMQLARAIMQAELQKTRLELRQDMEEQDQLQAIKDHEEQEVTAATEAMKIEFRRQHEVELVEALHEQQEKLLDEHDALMEAWKDTVELERNEERDALEQVQALSLETFRLQFERNHATGMDDAVAMFAENSEKMIDEYEQELQALKAGHHEQLKEAGINQKLEEQRLKHKEELSRDCEIHAEELDLLRREMQQEHKRQLQHVEVKLRALQQTSLNKEAQPEQLEQRFRKKSSAKNETLVQEEIDKITLLLEQERLENKILLEEQIQQTMELEEEVRRLNFGHEVEQSEDRMVHEKALHLLRTELCQHHRQQLQVVEAQLLASHSKAKSTETEHQQLERKLLEDLSTIKETDVQEELHPSEVERQEHKCALEAQLQLSKELEDENRRLSLYHQQRMNALQRQLEQEKLELESHHQSEVNALHRVMDAAIVEASNEATKFLQTGRKKLRDLEESKEQAIQSAVEQAIKETEEHLQLRTIPHTDQMPNFIIGDFIIGDFDVAKTKIPKLQSDLTEPSTLSFDEMSEVHEHHRNEMENINMLHTKRLKKVKEANAKLLHTKTLCIADLKTELSMAQVASRSKHDVQIEELKRSHESDLADIQLLSKTKIEKQSQELIHLKLKISALLAQVEDLENDVARKDSTSNQLITTLEFLKSQYDASVEAASERLQAWGNLENHEQTLVEILCELHSKTCDFEDKNESLQKMLDENNLTNSEKLHTCLEQHASALREQVKVFEDEKEIIENRMKEEMQHQLAAKDAVVSGKEADNKTLCDRIHDLKEKIEAHRETASQLKETKSRQEEDRANNQKLLQEHTEKQSGWESQAATLRKEQNQAGIQLLQQTHFVEELQGQIKLLRDEGGSLKESLAHATSELTISRELTENLQEAIKLLENKGKTLKKGFERVNLELVEKKQITEELQSQINVFKEEAGSLKHGLHCLNLELTTKKHLEKELQNQLKLLEDERESAFPTSVALSQDLTKREEAKETERLSKGAKKEDGRQTTVGIGMVSMSTHERETPEYDACHPQELQSQVELAAKQALSSIQGESLTGEDAIGNTSYNATQKISEESDQTQDPERDQTQPDLEVSQAETAIELLDPLPHSNSNGPPIQISSLEKKAYFRGQRNCALAQIEIVSSIDRSPEEKVLESKDDRQEELDAFASLQLSPTDESISDRTIAPVASRRSQIPKPVKSVGSSLKKQSDSRKLLDIRKSCSNHAPNRKRISGIKLPTPSSTRKIATNALDIRVLLLCPSTPHVIAMVKALGMTFIEKLDEAHLATHVVLGDTLRRTPTLYIALCSTSNFVSVDWLINSYRGKSMLNPKDYRRISDKRAEDRYRFSMKGAIQNGRENRKQGGMMVGWNIVFCEGVAGNSAPSQDELELIAKAAGAKLTALAHVNEVQNKAKLIVITSDPPTGEQLMDHRIQRVLGSGAGKFTTSWFFDCLMHQKLTGIKRGIEASPTI